MIDAIETITEAIPCNIVYGRKQAAQAIAQALSASGFTIMSKEDVEAVRDDAIEEAAAIADDPWASAPCEYATSEQLCKGIAEEIRSLKSKEGKIDS